MLKVALIIILAVTSLCAAEPSEPVLKSSDQAVVRLREALNAELKPFIANDLRADLLITIKLPCRYARLGPELDKTFLYEQYAKKGSGRIFGELGSAPDMWFLGWDGLRVFLDARTGKVLCIESYMTE